MVSKWSHSSGLMPPRWGLNARGARFEVLLNERTVRSALRLLVITLFLACSESGEGPIDIALEHPCEAALNCV